MFERSRLRRSDTYITFVKSLRGSWFFFESRTIFREILSFSDEAKIATANRSSTGKKKMVALFYRVIFHREGKHPNGNQKRNQEKERREREGKSDWRRGGGGRTDQRTDGRTARRTARRTGKQTKKQSRGLFPPLLTSMSIK